MNRFARFFRGTLEASKPRPPSPDPVKAEAYPPLPHVINELGFGPAQLLVIFTGGSLWMADAAELLIISCAGEAVQKDFGLTPLERSSFMTVVFLGVLLGNFFGGSLGDYYGRRLPIVWSFMGIFVFSLISAFSVNYIMLVLTRLVVGMSIGMGQPAETALIAELNPAKYRVMTMAIAFILFSIGEILSGIAVYLDDPLMQNLHWRVLVALSAIPALIFGLATYFFAFESPYYLAMITRYNDAKRVLEKMRSVNGLSAKDVPVDFEVPEVHMPSVAHQFKVVFSLEYLPNTIVLCFSIFLANVSMYGGLYAFAEILPGQGGDNPAIEQIIGAGWEIVGNLLGAVLGSFASRRLAVLIHLTFTSASYLMLTFAATDSPTFYLGYYGTKVWPCIGWIALYLWIAEIYPSDGRVTGCAICMACGRVGAMLGSPSFEFVRMVFGGYRDFMWVVALAFMVNWIAVVFMPLPPKSDVDESEETKALYGAAH